MHELSKKYFHMSKGAIVLASVSMQLNTDMIREQTREFVGARRCEDTHLGSQEIVSPFRDSVCPMHVFSAYYCMWVVRTCNFWQIACSTHLTSHVFCFDFQIWIYCITWIKSPVFVTFEYSCSLWWGLSNNNTLEYILTKKFQLSNIETLYS